jgi:hypothetical protein
LRKRIIEKEPDLIEKSLRRMKVTAWWESNGTRLRTRIVGVLAGVLAGVLEIEFLQNRAFLHVQFCKIGQFCKLLNFEKSDIFSKVTRLGTGNVHSTRANDFKKIQILNSVTRLGTGYYTLRANNFKKIQNFATL